MPVYFQKPENALKRANDISCYAKYRRVHGAPLPEITEFVDVGKKEAALDVLYDVIKSKKHRNWQKIHEPILKRYLGLCVDLRRSVNAKEGLYQYKLICQQMNIASLEDVIRYFLKLAEDCAGQARNESKEKVTVEDLDQLNTPEGILLSSVSAEDTQDRTDRVLLTPWVKFLWEAYRNVLDLLRNNNRVERLYQDTAQQAFKFCLKYARRTEFRKLCDHIRSHLQQVLKYQGQPTAINLNNAESLQMHLETRLAQLDSAISMELWQEAFKAVEDIHDLMQLSKKPPKPYMLANYYEKVALVFRKASNRLFHAATLRRQYILIREQKKSITAEELTRISSKVLLATLAIPIPPGKGAMEEYLSYDDSAVEKDRRLASRLGLLTPPTRASLIKSMVKQNVLKYVPADLVELYNLLEEDFQPLQLCKRLNEVFQKIENQDDEDLKVYIGDLKDIAIMRMLKEVSQVYDKMSFARLASLVPFTDEHHLERIIVDGIKDGDLQMTIDHRQRFVKFGSTLALGMKEEVPDGPHVQSMDAELTRNQLCKLSTGVSHVLKVVFPDILKMEIELERENFLQLYQRQERKEHDHILNRRSVIESRKERIENMKNEMERKEQAKIYQQQAKLKEAEEKRLEEERNKREEERKKQEIREIQRKQVWERVASLRETDLGKRAFKDLTAEEIEKMDPDDILARQVEQLDKEKREMAVKLKTQEKRIDHFARAMRLEEVPLLQKQYDEESVKDKQFWEQEEEEKIQAAKKEHLHALETKKRLERMAAEKEEFLADLKNRRRTEYENKLAEFNARLAKIKQERLEERRLKRIADRKEKYLKEKAEAKRKAEEERIRKEKEAEAKREEERRAAQKKEEEERQAKLAELERMKKERELAVEQKELKRRQEVLDREESARKEKDTWRLGGGGGSGGESRPVPRDRAPPTKDDWRTGEKGASDPTPAPAGSKYIPPSQRNRQLGTKQEDGGDSAWRSADQGERDRDRPRDRERDRDRDRDRDRGGRSVGGWRDGGGGGGGGGGVGGGSGGGSGGGGGSWRSEGSVREGRSWQNSRVSGRQDRDRFGDRDRDRGRRQEEQDNDGWTPVRH